MSIYRKQKNISAFSRPWCADLGKEFERSHAPLTRKFTFGSACVFPQEMLNKIVAMHLLSQIIPVMNAYKKGGIQLRTTNFGELTVRSLAAFPEMK